MITSQPGATVARLQTPNSHNRQTHLFIWQDLLTFEPRAGEIQSREYGVGIF